MNGGERLLRACIPGGRQDLDKSKMRHQLEEVYSEYGPWERWPDWREVLRRGGADDHQTLEMVCMESIASREM